MLSGDPRRPYPQDIEMRSGWLGRLVEGAAMETDQPMVCHEVIQSSASNLSADPTSGMGKF